jgi:uncharacterized cupredoxin-like copper-binding protein
VKHAFVVVVFVLFPVLVACTGGGRGSAGAIPETGGAQSGATQQLAVKATDSMRFDPATLSARAGQPIQLTLSNSGQLVHDFAISEGIAQAIKISAQPSQQASATLTIDKSGTYTYYCSEPGHRQAGMQGVLTVQ